MFHTNDISSDERELIDAARRYIHGDDPANWPTADAEDAQPPDAPRHIRKIIGVVVVALSAVIIAVAGLWPQTADQIASDPLGYGPPLGLVGILGLAIGAWLLKWD